MKAICFGDLHAHLFQEFSESDGEYGNTRLRDILNTLDVMDHYVVDNGIDYILFAGDMFHKRVKVDTLVENLVYDRIQNMSSGNIKIIMIPGNHDQIDNTDYPQHSLHVFRDLKNVTVLDRFEPYHIPNEGVNIYPVPYSKNAEMVKNFITEYAEDAGGYDGESILLAHLGITGATVGKSNYPMADAFGIGDLYPKVFDFGVFGHFHKPQDIGGYKNYFYTGSPIQHNFNDEGEDRGFVVIDTEKGTKERVSIDSPKFITVTSEEFDEEELKGNFVRFQIPADKVESLNDRLSDDVKRRIEPQKDYEEEKRVDLDFSMSMSEIVSQYCKEFRPEAEGEMLDILKEVE